MDKKILTVFRYYQDPKGKYFPVIPVVFHRRGKPSKLVDSSALIDSGATVSIFKAEVAETLGVEIENGKEIWLVGVGGHIKGYLHDVKIEIAGKKFVCPIVFPREYLVSFNLLGRQEFFKRFKIIFEDAKTAGLKFLIFANSGPDRVRFLGLDRNTEFRYYGISVLWKICKRLLMKKSLKSSRGGF